MTGRQGQAMCTRKLLVGIVCSLLVVTAGCTVDGRAVRESSPTDGRGTPPPLVLILDGSGSMTERDAPGPRIEAAKRAALTLIGGLPNPTRIGLMTYGTNTGNAETDRVAGCRDVTQLAPLAELDREALAAEIRRIEARGYTPISLALRQAADLLPDDDAPKSIILVSDGEDTCGDPPCNTAAELHRTHPGLVVSTVGFKTEGIATDELACIARATGGLFVSADNAAQLAARLDVIADPTLARETLSTTGYRGLEIGMTVAEASEAARNAGSELPDVATTGTETVNWVDCVLEFTGGVLVAITPNAGVWTIDGLKVGVDVARGTRLYGPPAVIYHPDGTASVVFPADDRAATGYRVEYQPGAGGQPSGKITSITLCRCKPRAQSGVLTLDYAERPALAWTTSPYQAAGDRFGDPRTYFGAREDTGFIQTDELIIVGARGAPGDRAVVGVDASNGSVRWASGPQSGYEGGCSEELPGGRLACGGDGGFTFISTETGEPLSQAPVPGDYYFSVVQVGNTLAYLASTNQTPFVVGGTDTDPDAFWRLDGQPTDADKPFWDSNGVVGTYCTSSVRGTYSMAFDEHGKEILPGTSDGCYSVTSGGELGFTSESGVTLFSSDGTELFTSSGSISRAPTNYGGGDLLFSGTAAYDRTGGKLWESGELSEDSFEASVIAVIGDTVVVQHEYDELVGLSASDGSLLWRVGAETGYDPPLTDGRRLITYTEDAGLIAYDVTDGSTAWTIPEAAGMQYAKLAASNGRIVVVGAEAILGYAP